MLLQYIKQVCSDKDNMYIYKLFVEFIYKHPWTIVFYFICTLLAYPLESIVLPQLYSHFFNSIKQVTNQNATIFFYFLRLIAVVLVVVNVANYMTVHIEAILIPEWTGFIMDWIFQNTVEIYENKMTDIELGKMILDISVIPKTMREFITDLVTWFFPRFFSVLAINLYFGWLNWKLGLVSFVLFAVYLSSSIFVLNKCSVLAQSDYGLYENKMQLTQDRLSNTFSIYSAGNTQREIENYQLDTKNFMKVYKEKMFCLNQSVVLTSFFTILTLLTIDGYAAYLFMTKELSYTNFLAVVMTVMYYIPNVAVIGSSIPDIIQKFSILTVVDEMVKTLYANYTNKKVLASTNPERRLKTGTIVVDDLTFSYSPEISPIIKHYKMSVKDKENVALVGPSGSGKSTLIKLLMGYFPVEKGKIWIDGTDISEYNLSDLRKQITYVNQNTKLFNMSVLENICYGNDDCSREQVQQVINRTKIGGIFENLGDGLDTNVGVDGNKLSGGQRQMVHILRAIMKKNPIVILDEPTSAMDVNIKVAIIHAIRELAHNSTLIVITHDESVLSVVDRIIRI